MRIVKELQKIDLHIHSSESKKDGAVVKNNTVDNIKKVLLPKLIANNVNIVAITDHNIFSYDHYNELKSYEGQGSLRKVLPGIEFDVVKHVTRYHVVVIFDDSDDDKIRSIKSKLKHKPMDVKDPKNKNKFIAYDFATFISLLNHIKIKCLTIAHQKGDPKQGDHNQDISGDGYSIFLNEIYIDYYDSLEFANEDVEGFLKLRKHEENLSELRFITSSDCHDWNFYPFSSDAKPDNEFAYTYIRALPTFKGLVMSLTDFNRIRVNNSAISPPFLEKINIKNKEIELSSGINVIIGDNSAGKSAILESLFSNKPVKSYHKNFIQNNKLNPIKIDGSLSKYIHYDAQESIKNYFGTTGAKLGDHPLLKQFFKSFDSKVYKIHATDYLDTLLNYLSYNDELDQSIKLVYKRFFIPNSQSDSLHLNINSTYDQSEVETLILINDEKLSLLEEARIPISKLVVKEVDKTRKSIVNDILSKINELKSEYSSVRDELNTKKEVKNKFVQIFSKQQKLLQKLKKDKQSESDNYKTNYENWIGSLNRYIAKYKAKPKFPIASDIDIRRETNPAGEYIFTTKVNHDVLSKDLQEKLIMSLLDNRVYNSDFKTSLENEKLTTLKVTGITSSNQEISIKDYIKQEYSKLLDKSVFSINNYINKDSKDLESFGNSPGRNALIYLDIIKEIDSLSMLVFDQPEDAVSQKRIKDEVIEIFRNAKNNNKQLLFVTHNPQLVVNLDVDNVIILKNINNEIEVDYGALEYEGEINILKETAELLDGGAEIVRKRWKRYARESEKQSE